MIRVDGLEKRYAPGADPVLRGLSLQLAGGSLAAVLGGSGCGKSTLLRCIVGLEPFERGSVALDDVVVRGVLEAEAHERERASAALRARVGVVFQSFELFPHLTALENCILAPMKVKGVPLGEAVGRAEKHLSDLGLAGKERSYPEMLSGGQRQRVAIARALAMEPRVLLYDEPTSALDPALRREVGETLLRVAGTGVTQIAVTHDLSLARAAQCVFVVSAGVVVECGPPAVVFNAPSHEATRRLLNSE